ncbi:MAG: transcriptional repressor [Opitutales bacterium]|nr:transcriptional repressor [Opitutales bacterium]
MKASEERVNDLIGQCRKAGLRRTECLRAILRCFVNECTPVSVQQLLKKEDLKGRCDPATVYRLLSRLEVRGIIRRVGLPRRAAHFVLNDRKDSRMYAVNTDSGEVLVVTPKWDEAAVLRQVSEQVGFDIAYYEIQFYGPSSEESYADDDNVVYVQDDEDLREVAED